jgi:hypothetical protein
MCAIYMPHPSCISSTVLREDAMSHMTVLVLLQLKVVQTCVWTAMAKKKA